MSSDGLEPSQYYDSQKKQWYSVKKQKWISPEEEIRMDGIKPFNEDSEDKEEGILTETEHFIEKIEAVERDRKESTEDIEQEEEEGEVSKKIIDRVESLHLVEEGGEWVKMEEEETHYIVEGGDVVETASDDQIDGAEKKEEYEYKIEEDTCVETQTDGWTMIDFSQKLDSLRGEDEELVKPVVDITITSAEQEQNVSEDENDEEVEIAVSETEEMDISPVEAEEIEEVSEDLKEEKTKEESKPLITIVNYNLDKGRSNVEVLEDIEVEEGEDKDKVKKLLAWAKGTKKSKTQTMVVRMKKREDTIKKAVDHSNMDIVIEDKVVTTNGITTINTGTKKFQVDNNKSPFEVRKKSVIQPSTVVTRAWLEKAVKHHEHNDDVSIVDMQFDLVKQGTYSAEIEAEVGGKAKKYNWTIKDAPRSSDSFSKDTFMVSDLGRKMGEFVDSMKLKTPMKIPFQRVIYADEEYAIFNDIKLYQKQSLDKVLDEAHLKAGMKALAKLHAISYAYFNKSENNIKEFAEVLKLLVHHEYQPSATHNDKAQAKIQLEKKFMAIFGILEDQNEGKKVLDQAKGLKNVLYNVYKEANQSSSPFSVLCHGSPTLRNIIFLYNAEGIPVEAGFVDFSKASYSSAVTDIHLFLNTAGDNTAREDFLLRFVYYETLASSLKALGVKEIIGWEDFKAEFVKKRLHGLIAGSGYLASIATRGVAPSPKRQDSVNKVVHSKILGKFVSKKVSPSAAPASDEGEKVDINAKICDMMARAVKL